MERILVILSEEQDYAHELASYLSSRSDFIFKPIVFTNMTEYRSFAAGTHIDMLLCEETHLKQYRDDLRADNICVLSELAMVGEQEEDFTSIFKFQSSQDIMKALIDAYGRRSVSTEGGAVNVGSRIISVFSPVGGARSSTFSLALADYCSRAGRCLFISFDPFFLLPGEVKDPKDKNLTDLLYYLDIASRSSVRKMSVSGLLERITHHRGNLDYITGVSHWFDIMDASLPAIHELLNALGSSQRYETVVFDLGVTGTFCMELLAAGTAIYVPVRRGGSYDRVMAEWRRQIEFAGQSALLDKVREIEVPTDEQLAGEYRFDQLLKGKLGRFIEETEGCGYIR